MRVAALCLVALLAAGCDTAKILGLFGHPGKSHFDVFEPLLRELASRGHELTVVSFFPQRRPLANYTDISLEGVLPVWLNVVDFSMFDTAVNLDWAMPYLNLLALRQMNQEACEVVLPSAPIQGLLRSEQTFDLVITELFSTDCFFGVIHKLQVPFMTLSSCTMMPWFHDRLGSPYNPAYMLTAMHGYSDRMNFLQRLENTVHHIVVSLLHYPLFQLPAQRLLAQHVDPDLPPLAEIVKNTSMLLVNTHFSLHRPRPLVPGIQEIGGIHIGPAKPLPEDMERFLSEAPHGVVLFSLGSMLKADTLDAAKRAAFLDAFRELPQRVIWKFETELEGLPDNVRIYPWLPQRDILEHPKVVAFLGHGGLLGMTEAVYTGKPVLGIPMYGDQRTNIRMAQQMGVAAELPYQSITKETVLQGLRTVLSPEYLERAQQLARVYRDRPLSPLDTAVYWVEYVLRHRGARHLRSSAVDLTFVQYHLLDVAAFLLVAAALAMLLTARLVRALLALRRRPKAKAS